MDDDPTRSLPVDSTQSVGPPERSRPDPTRTQPVDPWVGSARVAPGVGDSSEPVVVFVERRRRRVWPWILAGLTTLALVCCIGAIVVWIPISKEYPAHLELGDSAAGFDRVRDPDIDRATADLELQMFRDFDVDDGLAAMLEDPASPDRRVILLAATKLIFDPEGTLDEALRGVTDRPLRNATDYQRLGAILRCAATEDDQSQDVIVCAWVDHGSIGLGIYYGDWTMDEAALALRDLRSAVVRRG